jgi:GTP-binding protein
MNTEKILSAKFMRGVAGTDDMLSDGVPQVTCIGRSNVGKSSLINSLTGEEGLARTSHVPGMTQQINIYLINNALYLVDLPGYGYAKANWETKDRLQKLIYWYLFDSACEQKKVLLILDANVGPTKDDREMLQGLRAHRKDVVVVANKIDKIKKSEYEEKMQKLQAVVGDVKTIPYSSENGTGVKELTREILG